MADGELGTQCQEEVGEPPGYWHWHQCPRNAKFLVVTQVGREHLVCTQHSKPFARRGRTVTPLSASSEAHR